MVADEPVRMSAAVEAVRAGSAAEDVDLVVADEHIIEVRTVRVLDADERVPPRRAGDNAGLQIHLHRAGGVEVEDPVVTLTLVDAVVAGAAEHAIASCTRADPIRTPEGNNGVVTAERRDDIRACRSEERVVPLRPNNRRVRPKARDRGNLCGAACRRQRET